MWDLEYGGSAIDDLKPDPDSDRKRILREGFASIRRNPPPENDHRADAVSGGCPEKTALR